MDGGIPDTLLEGLGFYKSGAGEPEAEHETDNMDVDMTVESIEPSHDADKESREEPVQGSIIL